MSSLLNSVTDVASKYFSVSSSSSIKQLQDPSETISQVFSKLDTSGKGYLDAADFQSAFESLGGDAADESDESLTLASVDDVVSVLDLDGDGKVSSEDLSEGLRSLTDSLGFLQGRIDMEESDALSGLPPPPPPSGETHAGFSEEELTAQFEALSTSEDTDEANAYGTELLASILSQFDTADADDNGLISGTEAASFAQSLSDAGLGASDASSEESETAASTGASAATASSDATLPELQVMRRIMQLVQAYGSAYETSDISEQISLNA